MNPFREVNWRPGVRERRKFAVSLMIGFPCVAVVLLLLQLLRGAGWQVGLPLTLAGCGAGGGFILWLMPQIALPFYLAWYAVACAIGLVVGNVLLAAVYFLLFAPIGALLRAAGRSDFRKHFDRRIPTYWRDAEQPAKAERYYRQF